MVFKMTKAMRDYYVGQCCFTKEERSVLDDILDGMVYEDIGAKMGYSARSIKRRVKSIKEKINSL